MSPYRRAPVAGRRHRALSSDCPRAVSGRRVPRFLALALAVTLSSLSPFVPFARAQATIDIDTADATSLAETLPGIGPVKARRIVAYRRRHGPFGSLDALEAVKGIGPATLERIRAYLADPSASDRLAPTNTRPANGAIPDVRSSTELERATRTAVRAVVAGARRDARRARDGGTLAADQ